MERLSGPTVGCIAAELAPEEGSMPAPHLLDVEVLMALRHLARGRVRVFGAE